MGGHFYHLPPGISRGGRCDNHCRPEEKLRHAEGKRLPLLCSTLWVEAGWGFSKPSGIAYLSPVVQACFFSLM